MAIQILKKIMLKYPQISVDIDGNLTIHENDNKGRAKTLKKVIIKGLSENDCFAFKMDCYQPITKYFSTRQKFINKGCDAVIFSKKNEAILMCELKSYKFSRKEVANKLYSSIAFTKYLNYLSDKLFADAFENYGVIMIVFYLKKSRPPKLRMRPGQDINFNISSYENEMRNSLQIIEISKRTSGNFQIHLDKIIKESRPKKLENL